MTSAPELLAGECPCGYLVLSPDGSVEFANETFQSMTGHSGASLAGVRVQGLLTGGGAIFFETQFAPSLILRKSLNEIAFEFKHVDGSRVPVLVNAVLHRAEGEAAGHILLAVFGARQRRLYESELLRARRESQQIEETVRRSSDAILRLSPLHVIESWNRGAQQIFGFTPEEAIGQNLAILIAEEGRDNVTGAIEQLKRGAEPVIDTLGRRKTGEPIDVAISMTPHMEAPGILVGYSAILRDRTKQKSAEKALLQTEKLASVGRLASSIAHEINNPLEAVTNLLYILATRVEDAETKALVATAQEELARVSHIATHTLRFHKQSSGRTETDLQALFESVLGLYRARLQNAGIKATIDSPSQASLLCFEGELRQILVNLVANAFDAMRLGGRLVLRSREMTARRTGARGVRVTVVDTGTGMSAETLAHLFEPFFSTKGVGGTGLGLWITRDLVLKNEGTIQVRSCTREGASGTVISMVFPLRPLKADVPAAAA